MPKLFRIFALLCLTLTLVNCSFDPQVVKKKYLDSGNKYFDKGRYKEAQIMYRRALSKDQKYGEAWYKLAMTALKLNQAANAVPSLRRAAELLPKGSKEWNEANLNLGRNPAGRRADHRCRSAQQTPCGRSTRDHRCISKARSEVL